MTVEQVCGLGKKQGTQGDFRRESLQGLKKGLVPWGECRIIAGKILFGLNSRSTLRVGIAGYLQASVQGQFVEDIASVFKRGGWPQSVSGQGCFSLINVAFAGIRIPKS